jgi:hypothetical protein
MRQLSVIAMVTLVTCSAFGAAVAATDPPDIRLPLGTPLMDAFDLNDYFIGTAMPDGTVDIAGSDTVGIRTEEYTVDGSPISHQVKVSSFLVQNAPAIEPMGAEGNAFFNVLRPGVAVSSVDALVGHPGDGGNGTPGGGTPGGGTAPAWSVMFGNVSVSYDAGLRVRSSSVVEQPAGLTATIDEMGNYTLTATDDFMGPTMVTFISGVGDDLDGATVLAAKELSVGDNYAENDGEVVVDGTADVAFHLFSSVEVGSGPATVSVDVVPDTDGMPVGLAAIADPATFADFHYINPTQDSQAGQTMTLRITYDSPSGIIAPYVIAAGGTATYSNLKVYSAPAPADLAVGANELGLITLGGAPIDGNLNSAVLADLSPNAANSAPGTVNLSTENNFGAAGQSVALGEPVGSGEYDSILVLADGASLPGSISARAWVMGTGHLDFVIIAVAGGGQANAIGAAKNIDYANWTPVTISGQLTAADMVWVAVQGLEGGQDSIMVDDIKAMQAMDLDEYFDADLYGL